MLIEALSILATDWELQHFYQTDWDVKNNVGEKNFIREEKKTQN
jgi:hypothetical protein